jgi:hypothetical protein
MKKFYKENPNFYKAKFTTYKLIVEGDTVSFFDLRLKRVVDSRPISWFNDYKRFVKKQDRMRRKIYGYK